MRLIFSILISFCLIQFKVLAQQHEKQDSFPAFFITDNGRECTLCGFAANGMPLYDCTDNNLDVLKNTGTTRLWPGGSLQLNLTGLMFNTLGLFDGGGVRTTHREFTPRIVARDSNLTLSTHANAVAGMLAAKGLDSNARGVAYETNLNVWLQSNDAAKMRSAALFLKCSNHSYSSASGWQLIGGQWYWYGDTALHLTKDYRFGFYDDRARIWDSLMYVNPEYTICKSAGNSNNTAILPGTTHFYWNGSAWQLTNTTRDTIGPYDCIPTYGNAKNIITVGSNQNLPATIIGNTAQITVMSYSGAGPTDDGRIKPDIVAPSGNIYTTAPANDSAYQIAGGTSMSTPAVTASLLLLQQHYFNTRGKYMYNGLLKALTINAAISCNVNSIGPNYKCGWGMPRFDVALQTINKYNLPATAFADEVQLLNNDTLAFNVYKYPADTAKITIAWTDPAATTRPPVYNDTTLKLVNDLDMVVAGSNGIIIKQPFVLNPQQPQATALTGNNFRDNVEQIVLTPADTFGYLRLQITHKNTLAGLQQKIGICAGNLIVEPLQSARNIAVTPAGINSLHLQFNKGSGERRLILVSAGSNISKPQNGLLYAANDSFGRGALLGSNTFCVYNDTGQSVLIKNLAPSTIYYFAIVEYNGYNAAKPVYQNRQFLTGSNTTLPVVLNYFKATCNNEAMARLSWQTASELNNMGFTVLKSTDNINYANLAFVGGQNASAALKNYEYYDNLWNDISNNYPTVYYKLKQTDFNGKYTLSHAVSINLPQPIGDAYVMPNPFTDGLQLNFTAAANASIKLSIYALSGELLSTADAEIIKGKNNIDILAIVKPLMPGIYLLSITTPYNKQMLKIVKQ